MADSFSNTAQAIREVLAWRPVRVGLFFFCIAIVLSLTFILYMDSDLEKQMRRDGNLFVGIVTIVPMLFGFLQILPLYISIGEILSGHWWHPRAGAIITGAIVSSTYFGVGTWAGYTFRDKVFKSKMRELLFYSVVFCSAILMFSLLGGMWWYFGSS